MSEETSQRSIGEQERISLMRRSIFSFGTTLLAFGTVISALFLGIESTLAEKVVTAMMSYAELMAILYLGAGVSTKAINVLGAKYSGNFQPQEPQPPPYPQYAEPQGDDRPRRRRHDDEDMR